MAECKRCHAEILFAWTEKNHRMPIDPQPREDGNLATYRDHTGRLKCRVISADYPIQPFERHAMPHFATCSEPEGATVQKPDGTLSLGAARRRRGNERRQLHGG